MNFLNIHSRLFLLFILLSFSGFSAVSFSEESSPGSFPKSSKAYLDLKLTSSWDWIGDQDENPNQSLGEYLDENQSNSIESFSRPSSSASSSPSPSYKKSFRCPSDATTQASPHRTLGGDFTPFPWGKEVSITQNTLQGLWIPVSLDCETYFIFETTHHSSQKTRLVKVQQFDPEFCDPIAQGIGYELHHVFYVSMLKRDQTAYDLTIRAFNEKDLDSISRQLLSLSDELEMSFHRLNNPFMLVTLFPQNQWSKRISYPLIKSSQSIIIPQCQKSPQAP
jgi:hypothetical protein